jgi:hypothetical protein
LKALFGAALILAVAASTPRAHTVEEWEGVLALGTLEIAAQRDVAAAVTLSVEIVESETAEPTPAMIRLLDERGRLWIPSQAVPIALGGYRYAERLSSAPPRAGARTAPDYAILGEFTCSGRFEIELPPGTYTLRVRKGREYLSHRETIVMRPSQAQRRTVVLTRWLDMPKQGWYSGDGHLHYARRSRAANARLMKWIQAEDLHVANVLQM